jgi:DNA-binding MarR family transcriptional regulator
MMGELDPAATVLTPELAVLPGHLIWRAAAKVSSALTDSLPPGVDIHAYAALLGLAAGQARSQQWLADTVAVSRTTMTKVAARLVEQGLVERVRNEADRRSYLLTRTPEGAVAARRWRRHAEDLEERITSGFSTRDREELRRLLLTVAQPGLSPETPDALLDSIGFLVTRIHQRMYADMSAALGDLHVEPRHMGSMIALRAGGPMTQATLARQLGVSGPSVVELVDHLERQGLVERRRLDTDRRSQMLHLLPRAGEVVPAAMELGQAVTDQLLSVLTASARNRLVRLLQRFVTGG